MKVARSIVISGLDQLFFSPLIEDETLEDRADCIDNFLRMNGVSWDDILDQISTINQRN
jgi:hypothetical protein